MYQETKNGQPEGCLDLAAPVREEILAILRLLDADGRKDALRLLRELQEPSKGGGDHGAPPQPR